MLSLRNLPALLLALGCTVTSVFSAPAPQDYGTPSPTCTDPLKRKEWRALSRRQQTQYLKSVQCLASKPAQFAPSWPGASSHWDDFIGLHVSQVNSVHWVGHFIIWHRYLVHRMERALREECGWKLGIPYWDYTIDTATDVPIAEWPIFNATYGFGGNGPWVETPTDPPPMVDVPGRTGGGCVQDGPFTYDKFVIGIGPGFNPNISNPHCVLRDFAPGMGYFHLTKAVWNDVLLQPDFGRFAKTLETKPIIGQAPTVVHDMHGGGHFVMGGSLGTMGDVAASPGDPLFYMHHTNLDRLFWTWQKQNLTARLYDVSGPIYMLDYDNIKGGNVTLDFEINLGPLGETKKLRNLMDIRVPELCYTYDV